MATSIISNRGGSLKSNGYDTQPIQDVTAGATLSLLSESEMQLKEVTATAGSASVSVTPFGTDPADFQDGKIIAVINTDPTNTVTIPVNDAQYGYVGDTDLVLSKGQHAQFAYNASLERFILLSNPSHENDTSTHGVTEIVGRTESQILENKTIQQTNYVADQEKIQSTTDNNLRLGSAGTGRIFFEDDGLQVARLNNDGFEMRSLNSTPVANPFAGYNKLYFKNDNKLYKLDASGNEVEVGAGTGGAGISININETAHGFAVGDGIYHNGTNWVEAQANDGETLAQFVVTEVTDVNNVVAYQFGQVEITSHGFTVGEYYFLDATVAGTPTATEPASGYSCPLFYVLDANNLIINVHRPSSIGVTGSSGGSGDADTIHLIRANSDDIDVITQFSVDSALPNFDGTTAFGTDEGDISVPTSGSEALLSNENDHKVYKFTSESASQYSAWGMNLAIPRYVRGEDVVLQFKYRTADTSGDSQNADYMPWVYDQTSGVNTTFNDTPGTFAAGSSIVLTTTAGMAVGDKIWVAEAAGVVETHITAIPVAGTVQLADEVTCAAGARFVTGILTDVLTTLDAADDDTDKTGTDYKVVFRVPSTCAEVTVMWQQLTSQTDSFLYVDNILISSEVVKRVFARGESEFFYSSSQTNFWDADASERNWDYTLLNADITNSKYVYIDETTDAATTRVVAKSSIVAHVNLSGPGDLDGNLQIELNGVGLTHDEASTAGGYYSAVSASVKMEAGDYISLYLSDPISSRVGQVSFLFTPEVNDVVVVESTDSVKGYFAQATAADTYNVGSEAILNLNADVYDDFSMVDLANDRINILRDGTYTIGAYGSTPAGTSNWAVFGYRINGGGTTYLGSLAPTSTSGVNQNNERTIKLSAGDYLQFVIQNGAAVNTTNITITVEESVVTADYKPLLAFPTVTYGQDAENFIISRQNNFLDATGTEANFDYSLFSPSISGSNYLEIDETTDPTQTRIKATKRCKVHISVGATVTAATSLTIQKNTTNIALSYDDNHSSVTASSSVLLDAGEYLYIQVDNAFDRYGWMNLLVEPEEGQVNQAAIISQPVAYARFQASDTRLLVTGAPDIPLTKLDGQIAAVDISLSSNQVTFNSPGTYEIDWAFYCFSNGDNAGYTYLYNVTDSKIIQSGLVAGGQTNIEHATLGGSCVITITKPTTVKMVADLVRSISGGFYVGDGYSAADKGYVKITRKK